MLRNLCLFLGILAFWAGHAQEMPLEYQFGEKYKDRYKYSNLLTFTETASGDKLLVRAYYSGLLIRPKGYLIERYNEQLELIDEFNYKFKGADFVHGFIANGKIFLLFLAYDADAASYVYSVHHSPIGVYDFQVDPLLSVASDYVERPLEKNYYNRNFKSGFTTTVLADPERRTFGISVLQKDKESLNHRIIVFDNQLRRRMDVDFSAPSEEKNYAFEEMAVSSDLSAVYLVGKAYPKKKRFKPEERKYQYELVRLGEGGIQTQQFDIPGKFSEAVKPLWRGDELICAGFYADRRDNRYNGLEYFVVDPDALTILERKYNPFSEQFMMDKFGSANEREVRNLVFKGARFASDGSLFFNAEEFFITESMQSNASGGRVRIERYHYNDIVSVKLGPDGGLEWARNINKTEVTQGDGAYASYSSYTRGDQTYFFVCTSSEQPQLIGRERLVFKQGMSRSRNVFAIRLDAKGGLSYEKIIDDKEARLPLMVSKPFIDSQNDRLLFYAKHGSHKQLVSVDVRG